MERYESAFSQGSVCAFEQEQVLVKSSMLATVAGSPGLVLQERKDDASVCSLAPVEDFEEVCGDRRHRTDCTVRPAAEGQPAVAVAFIL